MLWGKKKPADLLLESLPGKILETIEALIVVLDPDGKIVIFNPRCQELTGYSESEVKGRRLWELLIPKEQIEESKSYFAELVSGHFSATHTYPWLSRDGRQRTIQWRSSTIADRQGKVLWVISTGIDVTDRLQEQQELQQMTTAIHYNPLPVLQLDRRGIIIGCNTAALRAVNRRRLIGDNWRQVCSGLNEAAFDRFLKANTPDPLAVESRIGGKTYLFTHFALPGRDAIQVYGSDMTGSRETQAKARENSSALQGLVETSPDAILVIDQRGNVLECNPAAEQLTGYRSSEMVGKNLSRLRLFPSRQGAHLTRPPSGRQARPEEVEITGKDRKRVVALVTRQLLKREGRQALMIIAHEVSERRGTQEGAARGHREHEGPAQADERSIYETVDRLGGRLAHDLRNRFSVVKNSAYFLELLVSPADAKALGHLKMIGTAIDQADAIIGSLRGSLRSAPAVRAPETVESVIDDALGLFQLPEAITVKREVKPDLPRIDVDRRQVSRIIANLIRNAREAMPQGGSLTLSADLEGSDVVIGVTDTGTGIAPEIRGRIFEPLFTTKPNEVGLGLFLARQVLQANSGRIDFTSEPGRVTTFSLRFPAARAHASGAEATPERASSTSKEAGPE